jgi:hypothetical protein
MLPVHWAVADVVVEDGMDQPYFAPTNHSTLDSIRTKEESEAIPNIYYRNVTVHPTLSSFTTFVIVTLHISSSPSGEKSLVSGCEPVSEFLFKLS